ncbi:GTPase Era [Auritidibacter ignavus]|uniref:GTPase Era n=1 Tax=Auritidibacter ignavus TaxID=678932 RepID=UPI00244D4645|nr:GTPase Era [Auritidibacter ignavus]WGH82184.1 GTPase Era [Auritidibacter ignavus]WGH91363.1 GTPase Era [Auritidibacter ignavus]
MNDHHAPQHPADNAPGYRAGFISLVGRPNAGKSTLTNALVGTKVAITSSRPQTTRRVLRGIISTEDYQLILVDTPGLHRPRTLLGEKLNDLVAETLAGVDAVGLCLPADEAIGPGDRFIVTQLSYLKDTPVIALVTKADKVTKQHLGEKLLHVQALGDEMLAEHGGFAELVPVSALTDFQVDTVATVLANYVPESPKLYPDDELTDEADTVMVAELIREAALEDFRDELPHSLAVVVEEMSLRERDEETTAQHDAGDGQRASRRHTKAPITDVYAAIYVERDSQKAIVIGTKAAQLRTIGARARAEIEKLLGTKVYLDLRVKVAKEWQRDPKQMRRVGFEDL